MPRRYAAAVFMPPPPCHCCRQIASAFAIFADSAASAERRYYFRGHYAIIIELPLADYLRHFFRHADICCSNILSILIAGCRHAFCRCRQLSAAAIFAAADATPLRFHCLRRFTTLASLMFAPIFR